MWNEEPCSGFVISPSQKKGLHQHCLQNISYHYALQHLTNWTIKEEEELYGLHLNQIFLAHNIVTIFSISTCVQVAYPTISC